MTDTIECVAPELGAALVHQLHATDQLEVLRFWNELSSTERDRLALQLAHIDWDFVGDRRFERHSTGQLSPAARQRINAPSRLIHYPQTPEERACWQEAADEGAAVLQSGRVAVVLVAGGVATRLGNSQPKGLFPICPVSGKSLYQLLAEQVSELNRRYRISLPYLIMTSEATHETTKAWFEQHRWFGLNPSDVHLFRQGSAPTFDAQNGKLLMNSRSSLALSPDGHGGLISAMSKHGLFDVLAARNIETLFYHQVDNPLVRVCDPAFLGWHLRTQADVSIKFVTKRFPEECVGNMVEIDGRLRMIEYTDLPQELAYCQAADGELKLRAGNTGIHFMQRRFLERVASQGNSLPWHSVHRKVPFLNAAGILVQPDSPNALKYEQFIFDVLPFAENAQLVETLREQEFAPLKNAEGEGSVKDVQRAMMVAATA